MTRLPNPNQVSEIVISITVSMLNERGLRTHKIEPRP